MHSPFKRVCNPGFVNVGTGISARLYVTIQFDKAGRLSLTGVEGPKSNGDCSGSCGQLDMHPWEFTRYCDGWTPEMVHKLREVWTRWHLNDMRAGCEHQRNNWNPSEVLEVVSYKLTKEAYRERNKLIEQAALATAKGELLPLTDTGRALLGLVDWFEDLYQPPDADSPLSGCYEVNKREKKKAGWVYPHQHERGLLTKPCEVCRYKYGSSWLREEVPTDVLEWLSSLPEASVKSPWKD